MVQCYRLSLMLGVVFSLLWAPQGQAWAQSSNTKRTLGAGDTIRLYVSSHKILNKKYQINKQNELVIYIPGLFQVKRQISISFASIHIMFTTLN